MWTCGSCCAWHAAASVCSGLLHNHVDFMALRRHDVDFIGAPLSVTCSRMRSSVSLGRPPLWYWSLDDSHKDCTGFLIMRRRPFTWRTQKKKGYYKFDNEALGFARVTNLRMTRGAQAQTRRLELAARKQHRKRLRKPQAVHPMPPAPNPKLVPPRRKPSAHSPPQIRSTPCVFCPVWLHPSTYSPFWLTGPYRLDGNTPPSPYTLSRPHRSPQPCSPSLTLTSEP